MSLNSIVLNKKVPAYAAVFFWVMILGYAWIAPSVYSYARNGYADFSMFYTAGQIVHRGQGHQLYDSGVQLQVQREFSHSAVLHNRALLYLRAPFEALLFVLFAEVPYIQAYLVWLFLCGVLVLAAAWLLRERIPPLRTLPVWLYYPAYFSFFPIAYGFVLGQDCALMLLLIAIFFVALLDGRDVFAGCILGLALIKFQLVLPLVLILIIKKQFRVLSGFVVVASALAAVSIQIVGWSGLKAYPTYLLNLNQVPAAVAIFPGLMPSLRGLVEGWMNPMHSSRLLDVVTAVLCVTVLVWAARRWDSTAPRDSNTYLAGLAMALLAALLAGYHAFSYDLSLLCPIALLALQSALRDEKLDTPARRILLFGAAGLFFAPLYLLLIWKAKLNLMAVFPSLLLWGYSRALKQWALHEGRS